MKIKRDDWIKVTASAPREGAEVVWTNGVRVMATHGFKRALADARVPCPATHYIPFELPVRIARDRTNIDHDRTDCNVRWHRNHRAKVTA